MDIIKGNRSYKEPRFYSNAFVLAMPFAETRTAVQLKELMLEYITAQVKAIIDCEVAIDMQEVLLCFGSKEMTTHLVIRLRLSYDEYVARQKELWKQISLIPGVYSELDMLDFG